MIPASIPPDSSVLSGTLEVLEYLESLPEDATGILRFGPAGMILIESRNVCWATAEGMEQRLTDLLRYQRNPPLEKAFLESVVQSCRTSGAPLGQALLASGKITEAGLHNALFRQTVEAIAHIGRSNPATPEFVPRAAAAYDARFYFSPAEILAALGGREDKALAAAARLEMQSLVVPQTPAVAFVRSALSAHHLMAAVHSARLRVGMLREACAWTADLFDMVSLLEPETFFATASWNGPQNQAAQCVVVWRSLGLYFTAFCQSKADAAVLAGRIAGRQRQRETQ